MSWAVGRTWLTGGRRRAKAWPARVGDPVGQVGPTAGDQLEGEGRLRRRPRPRSATPVTAVTVDALDIDIRVRTALPSMPYDATRAAVGDRSGPRPVPGRDTSPGIVDGDGRRHRCHVRRRGSPPLLGGPGGGRPVGPVVRTVPDPRADHRTGGRCHRRGRGPGQGQRGREPGHLGQLPGAVDPGRLRHPGRQGGRRLHRRPARGGGGRVRGPADARPRPRPTCWSTRGYGPGRRSRCAGPSSSSPTIRGPSRRWPPC